MINNIFTALAREKTPGAIMEFVLWLPLLWETDMWCGF